MTKNYGFIAELTADDLAGFQDEPEIFGRAAIAYHYHLLYFKRAFNVALIIAHC